MLSLRVHCRGIYGRFPLIIQYVYALAIDSNKLCARWPLSTPQRQQLHADHRAQYRTTIATIHLVHHVGRGKLPSLNLSCYTRLKIIGVRFNPASIIYPQKQLHPFAVSKRYCYSRDHPPLSAVPYRVAPCRTVLSGRALLSSNSTDLRVIGFGRTLFPGHAIRRVWKSLLVTRRSTLCRNSPL